MEIKTKIKKIKEFLGKLFINSAHHILLSSLGLLFLAVLLGSLLFYQKNILIRQKTQKEISQNPFLLKEEIYQKILEIWQEREKSFQESEFKQYRNPFK